MRLSGWVGFVVGCSAVWLYNALVTPPTDYAFFTAGYQVGLLWPMTAGGIVGLVAGLTVWGGCQRKWPGSPATVADPREESVWPPSPVGPVADADHPAA